MLRSGLVFKGIIPVLAFLGFLAVFSATSFAQAEGGDAASSTATEQSGDTGEMTLDDLYGALGGIAEAPDVVAVWWTSLAPDAPWLGLLVLLGIAASVAVGGAAAFGVRRALKARFKDLGSDPDRRFTARLGTVCAVFGIELFYILVFVVAAVAVGWLLVPGGEGARTTFEILLLAIARFAIFLALIRLLFAPWRPELRLVALDDRDASAIGRTVVIGLVLWTGIRALRDLLTYGDGPQGGEAFLGLAAAAALFAVDLFVLWRLRLPIGGLIRRSYARADGSVSRPVAAISHAWFAFFIAAQALAFVVAAKDEVLGSARELAGAQIDMGTIIVLAPFVIGAFGGVLTDLLRLDRDPAELDDAGARNLALGRAARTLGQGVLVILACVLIAMAIGADPFAAEAGGASRLAYAFVQASAAVLLGWAGWRGLVELLDHYAPKAEGASFDAEGMGGAGSRIQTLIPVIRMTALGTLVIVASLMGLAALGVSIGPLLASAGIIGLAVGFGAQTLVKDIITGLFYLMEDAFRTGEYIVTKAGKGVVEKIMLRSIQLRHHRGPLYTIPYSSMGEIENHSRDWVKVKFFLRVPVDTDLEKVRKLIKRVGAELLEHPDLGSEFLAPMKWQGVVDIEGAAFVIAVKFVSKPGEQFMIRREAYTRIKEAFAEEGLAFFAPNRVVVDTAEQADAAISQAGAAAAGSAVAAAGKAAKEK